METVQLNNFHDQCKGVTDFAGRHHVANDRGEVRIDSATAAALRDNHIVHTPRRSFGGIDLPKRTPSTD